MGRATRILFVIALIVFLACLVIGFRTFVWHGVNYEFAPKSVSVSLMHIPR